MGGVGPIAGGQTPQLAGWQTRKGMDVYQTPVDLFDALEIKDQAGNVLTAAKARPRGGLSAREMWDLFDMAHQEANRLPKELLDKYGIVPGTNPFAGKNPYGYPGAGGSTGGGSAYPSADKATALTTPKTVKRGGSLYLSDSEIGKSLLT